MVAMLVKMPEMKVRKSTIRLLNVIKRKLSISGDEAYTCVGFPSLMFSSVMST